MPATVAPIQEVRWRGLSVDERQTRVENLRAWDDRLQLTSSIRDHVGDRLKAAAAAGRRPLVLIGEDHVSKTSLLVELGAMKAVHDVHGKGSTVMIEHTPEWVGQWAPDVAAMQAKVADDPESGAAKDLEREMEENFDSIDHNGRQMPQHVKTKSHFAGRLGFAVTGFDTKHPPLKSRAELLTEEREQAMESAIRTRAKAEAAPVIVLAGQLHVPTLHERLQSEFDVITVSTVKGLENPFFPADQVPRASYLLTHPDVECVSTQGDTENKPVGYLDLMKHLGV